MKLFKYLACGLLVAGSLSVFTACDDDDTIEAPRLFSPVVNMSTNANSIECKWQGIEGAVAYELTLQRELTATDDAGNKLTEDVRKVTIEVDPTGVTYFSPYVFDNLDWDERYRVLIQAIGTDKTSNVYTGEFVSVSYPTKVKSVTDVVDTGVKLEWNADDSGSTDLAYINVFVRNSDGTVTPYTHDGVAAVVSREDDAEETTYFYTLTDEDKANGYVELYGLEGGINYRVIVYAENGDYRGRRDFTTLQAEQYPDESLVYDLRGYGDEAADTIISTDFFNTLPENAVVVLKGGLKYVAKGTPDISKSMTIKTGMSLSGKATISMGGMSTSGDIANLTFENVKLTCLDTDDLSSNFGGRYLFNHSNLSTVGTLTLENVDVKYMRGFIRTRKAGQRYDNIVINNCNMDSIGGYKVIHLDNEDTSIGNITITNSTFSNTQGIVRSDNHDNTSIDNIVVDNCTFAYCSSNAGFFLMKRDGCSPNLKFSMSNCIVGKNYKGSTGVGAAFNDGVVAAYNNVYVTSDFTWTKNADGEDTNPFGTYEAMSQSADDVWVDPEGLDFTLKNAQLPCAAAGDPRWRVN